MGNYKGTEKSWNMKYPTPLLTFDYMLYLCKME